MTRAALAAALALVVAACATGAPEPVAPPNFTRIIEAADSRVLRLYASDVVFESDYVPPLAEPNVEHEFAAAPSDIARAWSDARLAASGADGIVTVAVLDGSVVAVPVDQPDTVLSSVKDAPVRELIGTLQVVVDYDGRYGTSTAATTVSSRVKTNRYDSLIEVEKAYYDLLSAMAAEFDDEMTSLVASSFEGLLMGKGSGDGELAAGDCSDVALIDISETGAVRLVGHLVAEGGLEAALSDLTRRCRIIDALVVADEAAPGRLVAEAMSFARAAGLAPTLERRASSSVRPGY